MGPRWRISPYSEADMSYTIIIDERQRRLDVENVANRLKRHCRIGKVKFKAAYPKHPFDHLPPYRTGTPYIWQPNTAREYPLQWWQNPVVSTC